MIKVIFTGAELEILKKKDFQKIAKISAGLEKRITGIVEINAVSEKQIKELNRQMRGVNRPTDVLSFSWQEDKKIKTEMLGQIFICFSYLKKQAKRFGRPYREECVRMAAHGLLHLSGHDHYNKSDAARMFDLQEKIVAKFYK